MQMFQKGKRAVKLFRCAGFDTATIVTIASVSRAKVTCKGDEHLKYDPKTGEEIDPALIGMGITSRLVPLEE